MKTCPACSFSNDDDLPTCSWCNTRLLDVPAIPAADPAHPEHERKAIAAQRRQLTTSQIRFAGFLYLVSIVTLAAFPGLVFQPEILVLYALSSLLTFLAMTVKFAGQFTAGLCQGALSCTLLIYFGPYHPLSFFMLSAHVMMPLVLWHWIDLIYGLNH